MPGSVIKASPEQLRHRSNEKREGDRLVLSELRSAASNLRKRRRAQHCFEDITEEELPPGERDSVETHENTQPPAPADGHGPMAGANPSDSAAPARQTEPDAPVPIDESAEAALAAEEAEQAPDPPRVSRSP